ncbi:hypothetical protein VTL71DRAFT_14194 [Oculimacula yallundae]|uniref:Methyltransferase type 11 domain-containing protein n=1 Tax=Oculimacula yallundae TaxID=86028 RepID=A0ABR4CHS1_9HELO
MSSSQIAKPGFSEPGFSWEEYIRYRPMYPESYWRRIFQYHDSHNGKYEVAHDVGAGAGVATQYIAPKFEKIIVSDPNDGYVKIASDRLISQYGYPESKFTFLQEGGEKSSVESGTVDLIIMCEAIHWTDIELAVKDFARQLKPGGTLAVSHYGRPRMVDNPAAQKVWDKLFDIWAEGSFNTDEVHARALQASMTGLDTVPVPKEDWEEGALRVRINTRGDGKAFYIGRGHTDPLPNRVGEGDKRIYIEDDEDWIYEKSVEWLKGMLISFVPAPREEDVRSLWDEMEVAVGKGKNVKCSWPVVQLLATKRK